MYFSGCDALLKCEPWLSDGSVGDGALVADVNKISLGSFPQGAISFGNRLVFVANDITHGQELWTSDGTLTGTTLITDIRPGPDSGMWSGLYPLGGEVYFVGMDPAHGRALWSGDGTPTGTPRETDGQWHTPVALEGRPARAADRGRRSRHSRSRCPIAAGRERPGRCRRPPNGRLAGLNFMHVCLSKRSRCSRSRRDLATTPSRCAP